jgi:biopolymer transport protein ExbD
MRTLTTELNTTPLIDVLLVLLIFLILTLPRLTHETTLLTPQGSHSARTPVEIAIDVDGSLYWNGVPARDLAQIEHWLNQTARLDPGTPIQVAPDRLARYEPVVQVLAAAQRAHLENLGVRSSATPF